MYRRPLIGMWTKDISIYYQDERLPLCGHMQFMKEFGGSNREVEYEEGTFDKRKVLTFVNIATCMTCFINLICDVYVLVIVRSSRNQYPCNAAKHSRYLIGGSIISTVVLILTVNELAIEIAFRNDNTYMRYLRINH